MPVSKDHVFQQGERFVLTYKGDNYTCTLTALGEPDDGGKQPMTFAVDGIAGTFKSLSAAGSAVMGGTACNGWRSWTPEGEQKIKQPRQPKAPGQSKPRQKARRSETGAVRNIKRMGNQSGSPEGEARYFCSGCMDGFYGPDLPDGEVPDACPVGHPAFAPETELDTSGSARSEDSTAVDTTPDVEDEDDEEDEIEEEDEELAEV